ncbi:hypothetical protein QJ854_gp045 [Moumouvirus goulette]|uniref:Uncharacterized protein n=1 Tax=Moumouvirus goulette TaxID=1247379 RepID=M1PY79_9VIRU|nr:hypothetical protein QJ854_gp045 [Moumouvirus goulette]AGF85737.1 hypothetical protein glt_00934 [Moumouvirus goulette]
MPNKNIILVLSFITIINVVFCEESNINVGHQIIGFTKLNCVKSEWYHGRYFRLNTHFRAIAKLEIPQNAVIFKYSIDDYKVGHFRTDRARILDIIGEFPFEKFSEDEFVCYSTFNPDLVFMRNQVIKTVHYPNDVMFIDPKIIRTSINFYLTEDGADNSY